MLASSYVPESDELDDGDAPSAAFNTTPTDGAVASGSTLETVPKSRKPSGFFGQPAFLTVSGQLHLEAAAGALSRVFTFSPAFRAESHRGRHHLSEFYMVEAELAFVQETEIDSLMSMTETLVRSCAEFLLDSCSTDLQTCLDYHRPSDASEYFKRIEHYANDPSDSTRFMRYSLPYDEAMKILTNAVSSNDASFRCEPKYGGDFQREHEQYLVRHCGGLPLFVHSFPLALKPFYMKQCSAEPDKVDCFDLLTLDAGEICGGSLREDNYDRLARRLEAAELRDSLNWYLELRKFGHAGHGGFGVGFERLLQLFLGIKNIRDTVLFPRRYQDLPG